MWVNALRTPMSLRDIVALCPAGALGMGRFVLMLWTLRLMAPDFAESARGLGIVFGCPIPAGFVCVSGERSLRPFSSPRRVVNVAAKRNSAARMLREATLIRNAGMSQNDPDTPDQANPSRT